MSARVVGTEMHLDGLVVDCAPIIWRDPAVHEPPSKEELLVIFREPREGVLLREYCEWIDGRWRYVGDMASLPRGAVVLLWTHPPAIPAIEDEVELVA